MNCRVTIGIDTVVVGLYQVTLDVVKSFHFNPTHFLFACSRSHWRILCTINEFMDYKDGHYGKVLSKH